MKTNGKQNSTNKQPFQAWCKRCHKYYEVTAKDIFSGGSFSTYATRCPNCGMGRGLPFKEVEQAFGKLDVSKNN